MSDLAATHSPARAPPPPLPPRAAVLWFLDSAKCEDHGREWHRECAEQGSPASNHVCSQYPRCTVCHPTKPTGSPHCQYLHSFRVESHATAWSRRVGTRAEGGDLSESVDWVRRAAEGGLGLAMSRLATVLRNGKSVPRDDAAAARWYHQVSKGL